MHVLAFMVKCNQQRYHKTRCVGINLRLHVGESFTIPLNFKSDLSLKILVHSVSLQYRLVRILRNHEVLVNGNERRDADHDTSFSGQIHSILT